MFARARFSGHELDLKRRGGRKKRGGGDVAAASKRGGAKKVHANLPRVNLHIVRELFGPGASLMHVELAAKLKLSVDRA